MKVALFRVLLVGTVIFAISSQATEFNLEMLNSADKQNINTHDFSDAKYISPGKYLLDIVINNKAFKEYEVFYYNNGEKIQACLPEAIKPYLFLKPEIDEKVTTITVDIEQEPHLCLDVSQINGINISDDIKDGKLKISVPDIYRKKEYANWTPPELWETGVAAFIFDYNLNSYVEKPQEGGNDYSASIYGETGVNLGAWRFRAGYNGQYYDDEDSNTTFEFNDIHAYRPLPSIESVLDVGEIYLNSNIFNSFRLRGVGLKNDDRMLPPQLRGYSPTVTGVAKTNARVVIKYFDRIIYETTVPPGVFKINDLDSGLQGKIDVSIIEENGQVEHFEQYIDSLPYLSREGDFRYNFVVGSPLKDQHDTDDMRFASGELSYGLSSSTSLYGGFILSEDYKSYAIGVGQDFGVFGTFSLDATHSDAQFDDGYNPKGMSYRVNYSKDFNETHSSIQFSSYRFSEKEFLDAPQYIALKNGNDGQYYDDNDPNHDFDWNTQEMWSDGQLVNDKSLFVMSFSQAFFPEDQDKGFNTNLSYSRQTYWNSADANERLSLMVSKGWVAWDRQLYTSLSINNNTFENETDNSVMLNISMSLDKFSNINYSINHQEGKEYHNVNYSRTLENNDLVNVTAFHDSGENDGGFRGYYERKAALADVNVAGSIANKQGTSLSLGVSGGLTATQYGVALHPQVTSDSRIFVDTDGVSDVPIEGTNTRSNFMGAAIVDGGTYYSTDTQVDFKKLPSDIEVSNSNQSLALTQGAVGHLTFGAIKGERRMVILMLDNHRYPPFAATVLNSHQHSVGIVGDKGLTYLVGLNEGEVFTIQWNGISQCEFKVPALEKAQSQQTMVCSKINNG